MSFIEYNLQPITDEINSNNNNNNNNDKNVTFYLCGSDRSTRIDEDLNKTFKELGLLPR